MRLVLLSALATLLAGCTLAERAALGLYYVRTDHPAARTVRDLPYVEGPEAHPERHRLDLFLPRRAVPPGWPVVVFVHGGGWTQGSKDLTFGGEDVYGNIGRFFAAHGVGAAVINYRLQPEATWEEQARDVARAVAWVHRHAGPYGGDPGAVFLMGHSAGAHLAALVALDRRWLVAEGVPPEAVCGVIAVSGAALDLTDRASVAGAFRYYARRFGPRGVPPPDTFPEEPLPWQRAASPSTFARANGPAFLVAYAGGESAALQRQSERFAAALRAAGAEARVVVASGLGHARIVATLSRGDARVGREALAFVRDRRCG